jgi:predicted ATPase
VTLEVAGKCADKTARKRALNTVVITDSFACNAANASTNKRALCVVIKSSREAKERSCCEDRRWFKHEKLPQFV